jgi:hypothetical protein
MTLGRTQPPHKAHINMLLNAYLKLKKGDSLIHLIGSTNVDCSSTGKNLLSFEERKEVFVVCLLEALKEAGHEVSRSALEEQFQCLAVPDQTDSTATFPSPEMLQDRLHAQAQAKNYFDLNAQGQVQFYTDYPSHSSWKAKLKDEIEEALYQFIRQRKATYPKTHGIEYLSHWGEYYIKDQDNKPLTKMDNQTKQSRPVYGHGLNYFAWGINALTLLKRALPTGAQPKILYEVCGKDSGTQEYIDLLEFLAQRPELGLDLQFKVHLTPVESHGLEAMNATRIRAELLAMAQRGLNMDEAKQEIANKPESSLCNLPQCSFQMAYEKLIKLCSEEKQRDELLLCLIQEGISPEQIQEDQSKYPLLASLSAPTVKNLCQRALQKNTALEQDKFKLMGSSANKPLEPGEDLAARFDSWK